MCIRTKLCLFALLLSCFSQHSRSYLLPVPKTVFPALTSRSMSLQMSRRSRFGVFCLNCEPRQGTNTLEKVVENVQTDDSGNLLTVACKIIQDKNAGGSIEPHALDVITRDRHRLRVWYKAPESTTADSPVCLLLHGRTWSSIPV
jgi:hypothetical protein